MSRYKWEPTYGIAGRYRDTQTGRFVASSIVRKELDTYLDANDNAARTLAQMLRNKQIGLSDWELSMRRIIKNTHLNSIALERGGWANMRPSDYGRAGNIIRGQYAYLRDFALQIADGHPNARGGMIDYRAELYAKAGRNSWYESHAANIRAEVTHQRSVRAPVDSCEECIELDGKIFAIDDDSFPLPGDRICRSNCRCHVEYLSLTDGGYESLEIA